MQSINLVESPIFRRFVVFLCQGRIGDEVIPGRTCLTESIIKAWKKEQDLFYEEMKVSQMRLQC